MSDAWGMYLVTHGVLLLGYVVVRLGLTWDARPLTKPKSDDRPGTAIDASPLARRLARVKGGYTAELPPEQNPFKKPLLVEQRRREIARLAFFQHPVEPEEPEKKDGLRLLFV